MRVVYKKSITDMIHERLDEATKHYRRVKEIVLTYGEARLLLEEQHMYYLMDHRIRQDYTRCILNFAQHGNPDPVVVRMALPGESAN